MGQEDPEERIAELERQLAEQKRIAELEHQLADAKRAAGQVGVAQPVPPPTPGPPRPPRAPQSAPMVGLGGRTGFPAAPVVTRLAEPPRRIPAAFWLAELLPFRWWYLILLFGVGMTLYIGAKTGFSTGAPGSEFRVDAAMTPVIFTGGMVLTLVVIYAFRFWGTRKRFALLKWGQVANVTGTQILSRGTYYSGTTFTNVVLPVAHGWKVERPMYSGPSTKTRIRYTINGYPGELVVRGREYIDGVVLADPRKPAQALCVTSFPYDLDRDESGNWIGRIRPRLMLGMAVWLIAVIGWLAAAAVVLT
jgi:hypothetical protein